MDCPAPKGNTRVSLDVAHPSFTSLAANGNSKPKKKSPATMGEPATLPTTRAPGASKSKSLTSAISTGCDVARSVIS